MKIEIKHRTTNSIIVEGEYESLKVCCEKNSAYLRGADLRGADLCGANLGSANLRRADLCGAYLGSANLGSADLCGANLGSAYLYGAYLDGAYLGGANLDGAKKYLSSHDFFSEIIKRQSVKTFTEREWKCIAVISIHRICWDTIKKQFGKTAMSVFKKLAKVGFDEWEIFYRGLK